jgi:arylamine N-acetyltransferase
MTITPAALTITADDKTKVYGAALPTFTASYTGLVNGDTPASLTTAPSFSTTATSGSGVGNYPITVSGAASANYTISFVNGTLTVTRAPLTITADDKSRAFLQPNPPLTATYSGFVNGDGQGSLLTPELLTTTALLVSPPGSYPIVAIGATAANYSITHVNGTLTVLAANAPEVAFPAGNLNYTENSGAVVLDGTATVTDGDSPNFGGGSLTVDFKINGTADDRLAIHNQGTGAGQIGVSGSDVSYGGVALGSFAGGTDGATPLVVSLNDSVTPEVAQALLRQITFENVSDLPSTLTRTVRAVVDDGHGGTSAAATMTVSVTGLPDNPTVDWTAPAPITYGTALGSGQLTASANVAGAFVYSPPAGTVLHAGNGQVLSVTFTPEDTANYNTVTITRTIDVLPAGLVISADNKTKVYGAVLPPLTANYAGFVNGDTPASLDTPIVLATGATAASSVGNYPITASGASDPDYAISFVAGTLTVTPAALTITADNKSKAYGAALPTFTASYSGFVNGDTAASLDTPVTLTTTATANSAVGTYPITASGAADLNYTITFVNGTLTVTAVTLTITADNKTKVYGADLPTLTVSYAGFVAGDTAASLDTPVTVTTTATPGSPVGTYPITPSGAADANYTIVFVNGTLTVTPAALTITADHKTKVYGDALPTLTASYAGFVNGDTAASLDTPATLTTTATAASAVGTYPITVSGAADVNYTISFVAGTLSVTPATLTITADNKSKGYGAALPVFTASYAGFVNGDTPASLDVPVTLTTTATAASPVGAYPIEASGAADLNYTIHFVNGTLTVTRAVLTITADDKSKVYGAPAPTLTASYSGFLAGDTPASLETPVTLSVDVNTNSPVGTYPIVASGATSPNYTIVFVNGTLTVTRKALTITAVNQLKVYGAPLPTLTAIYNGFVNGETAAVLDTPLVLATTATASSPVGTYPITATGASDANYSITMTGATLTVSPAALSVRAADKTMTYGGTVPALTITYSGFVNGDTAANLTTPASSITLVTSASPAGTYLIVVSGATSPNYIITHVNGVLTVGRASLVVTADNKSKAYGAALPAFTASYAGFVNGDTPASLDTPVTFSSPATSASSAGTYPIILSGASDANYTITFVNGTLTITAVPLTVTAEAKSKVYGAPLPAFTASYVGFVNGDTPASLATPVSFSTTASASSSVGTYPITPGGAVSPNYIFTYVGSTLTVTPALLTITADNKAKVFLGVVPTLTASYAGLVNGDTPANLDTPVTLTTTAEQTSPVGNYPITASGAADLNYVITLVNGTLMVIELPPQLVILGINAAGDVSLQITCQPGLTLDVEESSDLSVWTQLTRLEVTTGATNYVDVGGGNGPKKFYRLKVVP